MKLLYIMLLVTSSATLLACSNSGEEDGEHFLSGQQRALERAQDVNNVIQQAEDKKRQQLEMSPRVDFSLHLSNRRTCSHPE